MALELFLISISITLLVLSAILVALLTTINRSLGGLFQLLGEFRRDLAPVLEDVRVIRNQAVVLSESLRGGLDGVVRMSAALGEVGDDLQEGRRVVRGGFKLLERWVGPWVAKIWG